jgi:hypothetical protein
MLPHSIDQFSAIADFRNDVDLSGSGKHALQTLTDHRVIVSEDDA